MLEQWYNNQVLEYFLNPRNVGCFPEKLARVGSGLVGSRERGEIMLLQIQVDDNENIIAARQLTYGCGCAIAANSWLSEYLVGLNLAAASEFSAETLIKALKLAAQKQHCAWLAADALKAALRNYQNTQNMVEENVN